MTVQEVLAKAQSNGRNVKFLGYVYVGNGTVIGLNTDDAPHMTVSLDSFGMEIHSLKEGEAFVIGRDKASDFVLPQCRVFSRFHCFIERCRDGFRLYDASLNGTAIIKG